MGKGNKSFLRQGAGNEVSHFLGKKSLFSAGLETENAVERTGRDSRPRQGATEAGRTEFTRSQHGGVEGSRVLGL